MYCYNCSRELPDGTRFCTSCGAQQSVEPEIDLQPVETHPMWASPAEGTTLLPSVDQPEQKEGLGKGKLALLIVGTIVVVLAVIALTAVFILPRLQGPSADVQNTQGESTQTAQAQGTPEQNEEQPEASVAARSEAETPTAQSSPSDVEVVAAAEVTVAATAESSDYILPDSGSRYYTEAELINLSNHDLYIARNEIFARHGFAFTKPYLQSYFGEKDWYTRQYSPEQFEALNPLNNYERENTALILSIEKRIGSPYI